MRGATNFVCLLLIAFAGLQLTCSSASAAFEDDDYAPFKIVMLRGSNVFAPTAIIQDQHLRNVLQEKAPNVRFFVEILDSPSLNGSPAEQEFLSFFRQKYRDQQIDLFLVVGRDALRFASRYRRQLLPATPLLFYNVSADAIERSSLPPDATGVVLRFDLAGTLDLAMRLQPDARRVVVIGGVADYDKSWLKTAREALAPYEAKLAIEYWTQLSLPEIVDNVKKLSPETIVLFLSMVRDATGQVYHSHAVLNQISVGSWAPVYGARDIYLGQGIVGGVMPDYASHGTVAGEIASRLLAGEKPNSIPVHSTMAKATADWRELKRWRLDERHLPPGTAVEFRQTSIWGEHQTLIIAVILAGLAQMLLIVALLLHRAKRVKSERALEKQLQFERLIAEMPATLIQAPLSNTDAEVERALEQVCRFMDLDRCHVFEYSPNLQQLVLTHHCRSGDEPNPGTKLEGSFLPWLFGQLRQGSTIVLEDVARELPQNASEERAYAFRAKIKSMLVVPVRTSPDRVRGISLQTTQQHQRWPEDLIKRIHLVGEILISALSRARAEEALRISEERYRTVVEEQTELVCRFEPDSTLTFVNAAYANHFAVKPEDLIGRSFLSLIAEPDRERVLEHIHALAESKQIGLQEHRVRTPKGEVRWQHWVSRPILDNTGNVVEFQSVGRDVTEIKRAEEALQQSEERLRLAMQAGRLGAWDWRPGSEAVTWSKTQFEIMGFDALVPPTRAQWEKSVHPEDLPVVLQVFSTAIREKREHRAEYRILRPDGQLRWIFTRGQPIYDENGNCIRVLGIAADITERKRAETALQEALEQVQRLKERVEAENVYLRAELSDTQGQGQIVGKSTAIQETLGHIAQVAPTNVTVLILGETGTGKELVARAVHQQSARHDRPLVKVNCAALPANLIESELFGHEKGAFTGASARQVGRFEFANGGTIFLDEIGELPLSLQTKLLRVLQEGEFERLGSGKTIKVDVRVIAATNRDLEEALRNQTFRQDLYYRLNVYPIRLAPLRERKEDIALLAASFLTEVNRRLGRQCHELQQDVLEALRRYDWPGNVRELQNVLERAALLSRGNTLRLPEGWNAMLTSGWIVAKRTAMSAEPRLSGDRTLEQLEREHIFEVLQQTGWRIEGPKGAALKLGLNPSTLRSRMLKLKLQKSRGRERNGGTASDVQEI